LRVRDAVRTSPPGLLSAQGPQLPGRRISYVLNDDVRGAGSRQSLGTEAPARVYHGNRGAWITIPVQIDEKCRVRFCHPDPSKTSQIEIINTFSKKVRLNEHFQNKVYLFKLARQKSVSVY
jgi:hypothetical protein